MTDRRTALLHATIEQIALKGERGMRVEEVARAAGVSPALIYHHFGDRATLLRAALEHIGAWANAYTAPGTGNGRDGVVRMLTDEIQDAHDVRVNSSAWGELRNASFFEASLRPTITALTGQWIDDVAELIERGRTDGSIAQGADATDLATQLTATVEGLSGRWLTGQLTTDEARRHVADLVGAALGPVPTRRRQRAPGVSRVSKASGVSKASKASGVAKGARR